MVEDDEFVFESLLKCDKQNDFCLIPVINRSPGIAHKRWWSFSNAAFKNDGSQLKI
jgi:hypothetical protein